nr:MAG TPA: hypothetical protein [Caudoviricetes sp.]
MPDSNEIRRKTCKKQYKNHSFSAYILAEI